MPHGHIGRSMGPPVIHTPSLLCVAPLVRYCRYHHAAWEGPAGPDTLCHQPGSYCGPWPPSAELVPETATNDNCCPTCWSLACQCLVASLVAISHPCMCGARRPAQASASPQTIEDFDFTFTAPEGGFRSGWTWGGARGGLQVRVDMGRRQRGASGQGGHGEVPEGGFRSGWTGRAELLMEGRVAWGIGLVHGLRPVGLAPGVLGCLAV